MNLTRLVTTTIVGATLSSLSAFAALELPQPVKITAPSQVSRIHEGSVVEVALTVDTQGRAQQVRVARPSDATLERKIRTAAAHWEFSPARKGGRAVPVRVVLPLRLAADNK